MRRRPHKLRCPPPLIRPSGPPSPRRGEGRDGSGHATTKQPEICVDELEEITRWLVVWAGVVQVLRPEELRDGVSER
jgi:hypothetical protein